MPIGWKATYNFGDGFVSWGAVGGMCCKYAIGVTTTPRSIHGPLFLFDTEQNARAFVADSLRLISGVSILEVDYAASSRIVEPLCDPVWPTGTIFAETITPIRRLT